MPGSKTALACRGSSISTSDSHRCAAKEVSNAAHLAVITGGSRGLGAALDSAYREMGWTVVQFSRTESRDVIPVDLADTHAASIAFERTLTDLASRSWGEVVAIGNAGVLAPSGPVERASYEAIVRNVHVNVTSAVLFVREFSVAFAEHACPKTFVNVSSGAAIHDHAGWSLYSAGKAAMERFVSIFAAEQALRQRSIRAFSVNPGVMDTAMQAEVRASSPRDFPERDRYVRLKHEGRLQAPDDVAGKIIRLVESRPQPGGVFLLDR